MSNSHFGASVLADRYASLHAPPQVGGVPVVGFIPPTIIYDRMRAIDAEAKELDTLVRTYVSRDLFKNAWAAWYANWRAFFEKYRPDSEWWGTMAKLGGAFYTEELAAQVEGKRIDLERFRAGYLLEKQANGAPVPLPPTPQVLPPPEPPAPKSERPWWVPNIPWWGWVLSTVAVGGIVYSVYKQAKAIKASERAIRKDVLPKFIGPDLAHAANAGHTDGDPPSPAALALAKGPVTLTEDDTLTREAPYEQDASWHLDGEP